MSRPRIFLLGIVPASVAVVWAVIRWTSGRSLFGFESPYWDLGLLPTLAALVWAGYRLKFVNGPRRRFLIGFLIVGLIAVVAYTASCSRPAQWSFVSMLQPFQTGFMLAPRMGMSRRHLRPWGVFVDSVILILIPLLPALLGGLVVSIRITLGRMMAAIAVIAILFGGVTTTIRRARHQDQMGHYHRTQIAGILRGHPGLDGTMVFEPQPIDSKGRTISPQQQKLDRWHEDMAQKYWHSSPYPWSAAVKETPPPE